MGLQRKVFRLTEGELVESLHEAVVAVPGVHLSASAGAPTLSCESTPDVAAVDAFTEYFRRNGKSVTQRLRLDAGPAVPVRQPKQAAPRKTKVRGDPELPLLSAGPTSRQEAML